ncbi:MAG TPA: hypothetical protein VFK38_06495 [Candidatus Limnocylindrales bacterium]|nr:hypothetical protein [Candidatus Limnocylindrales bacterium]
MASRHQSRRRRNYGRRQHELHERQARGQAWVIELDQEPEPELDEPEAPNAFFDLFGSRLRFAEGGR